MGRRVSVPKVPKSVGEAMRRAGEALGPVMFCSECHGWVNTWHVCSFPMARPYVPVSVVLEGGLTAEELEAPAAELEVAS